MVKSVNERKLGQIKQQNLQSRSVSSEVPTKKVKEAKEGDSYT